MVRKKFINKTLETVQQLYRNKDTLVDDPLITQETTTK